MTQNQDECCRCKNGNNANCYHRYFYYYTSDNFCVNITLNATATA